MPTSIHVPDALLRKIDERASQHRMSRNRYIVQALEQAVHAEYTWSDGFRAALLRAGLDEDGHQALDEMMDHIKKSRSRKKPPKL